MNQHKTFTLVEVVVGVIILALVIAGTISGVSFSIRFAQREHNRLVAATYAHRLMERFVFEADYTDPLLSLGNHTIKSNALPRDDRFWQKTNPSLSYAVSQYELDTLNNPGNFNLAKLITITISWQEPKEDNLTVITFNSVKAR